MGLYSGAFEGKSLSHSTFGLYKLCYIINDIKHILIYGLKPSYEQCKSFTIYEYYISLVDVEILRQKNLLLYRIWLSDLPMVLRPRG